MDALSRRVMNFLDPVETVMTSPSASSLNGYVALAVWDTEEARKQAEPISAFRTAFSVPEAPLDNTDVTLFVFPGMQPSKGLPYKAIIQPVLQWGTSSAGGYAGWSVGSYFVRGAPTTGLEFGVYSDFRPVTSGQDLAAVIKLVGERQIAGKKTYRYSCEFEGVDGTRITIETPDLLVNVGVALEIYDAKSCLSLPSRAPIVFSTSIESKGELLHPKWLTRTVGECGLKFTITETNGIESRIALDFSANTQGGKPTK